MVLHNFSVEDKRLPNEGMSTNGEKLIPTNGSMDSKSILLQLVIAIYVN